MSSALQTILSAAAQDDLLSGLKAFRSEKLEQVNVYIDNTLFAESPTTSQMLSKAEVDAWVARFKKMMLPMGGGSLGLEDDPSLSTRNRGAVLIAICIKETIFSPSEAHFSHIACYMQASAIPNLLRSSLQQDLVRKCPSGQLFPRSNLCLEVLNLVLQRDILRHCFVFLAL